MRSIVVVITMLAFGGLADRGPAAQPNVVVIIADDLGYSDIGCYGGEIETPNLDQLAAAGIRFSSFYNTARCWPTRSAILTGYYPQQISRDALPNVPGGGQGSRPAWAQLLPRMLSSLGYRSYLSGKWHVDGTPILEGFHHSYTMDDHNRFFYPHKHALDDVALPPVERGTDYYQTTAIANHVIECLQEHANEYADKPFFQYVAFTSPHFPLHAPAADIAKYAGRYSDGWDVVRRQRWNRIRELGLVTGDLSALEPEIGPPYPPGHFRGLPNPAEVFVNEEVFHELNWTDLTAKQQAFQAAKMEIHAAMVDRMDQEIGRIIDQLKAMNAFENTLVLFLSDNGASAEIMIRGDNHDRDAALGSAESYLCLGPGWSSAANTPFRRHKTWVHEGGTSTPLIAHWPAGIADAGQLRHQVGHVIDIPPTIVELAGGRWTTEVAGQQAPPPPGQSLLTAFRNEETSSRLLWWLHEGHRAIREGDFKLVAASGEAWQLYDMQHDRAEMTNLATSMPQKAQELAAKWNDLTAEFEALAKANAKANNASSRRKR